MLFLVSVDVHVRTIAISIGIEKSTRAEFPRHAVWGEKAVSLRLEK